MGGMGGAGSAMGMLGAAANNFNSSGGGGGGGGGADNSLLDMPQEDWDKLMQRFQPKQTVAQKATVIDPTIPKFPEM